MNSKWRNVALVIGVLISSTFVLVKANESTDMEPVMEPCMTVPDLIFSNPQLTSVRNLFFTAYFADPEYWAEPENEAEQVYTILLPTNEAFEKLNDAFDVDINAYLFNPSIADPILKYHIIPDFAITAAAVQNGTIFETSNLSANLTAIANEGYINILPVYSEFDPNVGAVIEYDPPNAKTDIRACSAIMHIIDTVLLPEPIINT